MIVYKKGDAVEIRTDFAVHTIAEVHKINDVHYVVIIFGEEYNNYKSINTAWLALITELNKLNLVIIMD